MAHASRGLRFSPILVTVLFVGMCSALAIDNSDSSCPEDMPNPSCPTCFQFCVHVPKGTPQNIPDDPNSPAGQFNRLVLVVERDIPHWGLLSSMTMAIFRNGQRVYDISLYSVGITKNENTGKLRLKFQLWDRNVDRVEDNDYIVQASFRFEP